MKGGAAEWGYEHGALAKRPQMGVVVGYDEQAVAVPSGTALH